MTWCAAPNQVHPWYQDIPYAKEWVDREDSYGFHDVLRVPYFIVSAFESGDLPTPESCAREVMLTRYRAVAPMPHVGPVPLCYTWNVGIDRLDRQVAGEAKIITQPWELKWAGPFDIG